MLLVTAKTAKSQNNAYEGKKFFVSALRPSGGFGPQNNFVLLWSRTTATVTISNTAKSFSTTVNLNPNTAQSVTLPLAASHHESNDAEKVEDFGVEITSNNNISVQFNSGGVGANSSDGTMVYPIDKIGTEYYAMSFEGSGGFNSGRSTIIIVGTENNSLVEITPSTATTGNKAAGTPFFVSLNKGQTYRLEANGTNDLTGTKIRVVNGCKKIAVFSGSECSQVPSSCNNCGHLMEMMPHVDTWGKTFFIPPFTGGGFQPPRYTYRVLSIANGTKVTINGTTTTLNKGDIETSSNNNSSSSVCIEATNPVLVAQYTEGFGCQGGASPRMGLIPPAEQLVESALIYPQNAGGFGATNKVLIITKTNSRQRVRRNNVPVGVTNFTSFTNCNKWSYTDISINQAVHSITSDSGFIAYQYSANFNSAYIYQSAVNSRIIKYDIGVEPLVCGSTKVTFYNTGDSDRISSSQWLFEDNTSLNGKKVTKDFGTHDKYVVNNIVTYQDVCPYVDTLTTTVRTFENPDAGFSVNDSVQCFIGNDFLFTDTSKYFNSSTKSSTTWVFGDTNVNFKNQFNITRNFSSPGIVPVKFYATSTDNCIDSFEWNVKVNANPKPDYQVSNPQCFNSHSFDPIQLSSVAGGTVTNYEWLFGDGSNSFAPSPNKQFAKDDTTYEVILIATANTGCSDTITGSFTILPSPSAAGVIPSSVCLNDSLKAINSSTFPKGTLTYLWKFGDGTTSTQQDIVKSYNDTGTYNLVLTAVTNDGCPDSVVSPVDVLPTPEPDFTINKDCSRNFTAFTNQTFDYGLNTSTFKWDVGDSIYTTSNVNHIYDNKGAYTVRLYATLPNGCQDSTKQDVYINPSPDVDFIINDSLQCIRGNNFDFFNNTTISEGNINQFTWKLNDTFWNNNISINQSFNTFGKYTLELIAVTDSACSDSIVKDFEIAPQTAMDLISGQDTQCFKDHSFPLTNNSSIPAGTVKYQWKYSNGDLDTIPNPGAKTFNSPGKYQLTLLAISDKQCRDSVIKNFTIYPSPELDFEVNDVCGSDSARFFNPSKVSTGRIITWDWDLGDGTTSTEKRPVHFYNSFGHYDVRLIGITNLGCPDTLFKDSAVKVKPAPTSFFNTELISQRSNVTTYDFRELSQGADNFFWNFDRGETSREENPRFTFRDTGTYRIILTVSNNDDCFDHYDTVITIVPDIEVFIPNAFSPNKDILNSVFRIEGSYFYREFEMRIFDRWGQQLFYTDDPEIGWDGSYDNRMMPEGVYIYHIRMIGTDTKVRNYKGNLHLFR